MLVVRAPATDESLTCAGGVMACDIKSGVASDEQPDIVLGKRYADDPSGLEVLCVKAGRGPLRFGARDLVMRAPKALPSSD
ncbi:hypothetical protein AWC28_07290 [Mycolicibacter terrae]|nr:hypothetical protein AWC28_07290 [Mycolicibacter terrae]